MLYAGFDILPRSVFWSAYFNGRSDNLDVIRLKTMMTQKESIATSALESIGCWTETSDGHTTWLSFESCGTPDYAELRHVADLPYLKDLCFYGTPVDGAILSSLTCGRTLTSLNLNCTSISTNGIKEIAKFPKLNMLGLMATATDDSCLESLLLCPEITNLRIDDTQITASGTTRLVENLELTTLWIGGDQISSESLAAISRLSLHEFHITGESVVDAHIELILAFPKTVSVRHTRISNPGLERLVNVDPNASNVG